MSKAVNDILLIKKYLAGELDASAMNDLERRALDDPFLADAIEGYEHAAKDQQNNLDDLSARLYNRAEKKVSVITPRVQLSIAASLLVIIGIGAWLVVRKQETVKQEVQRVAVTVKPAPKPEQPTISAPSQAVSPAADTAVIQKSVIVNRHQAPSVAPSRVDDAVNQSPAVAELPVAKPDSSAGIADKSTIAGNANNAAADNRQPPADAFKYVPKVNEVLVQSINANNKPALKKARPMVPETLLNAHEEHLDVQPASHGNYSTLVGQVTGNNQPLAGAIVKLSGATFGVATDANGRFVMHNVPDTKSLEVKSLGYATKQVKLNGRDSINISLDPNMSSLSEVVVNKPETNNNDDRSSGNAGVHPKAGWQALNRYLDKAAISPDGKTGKAVIAFTVDGNGLLSGFTIVQSLSTSADQKAEDLISNGPGWTGSIDGQPHRVTMTISFH